MPQMHEMIEQIRTQMPMRMRIRIRIVRDTDTPYSKLRYSIIVDLYYIFLIRFTGIITCDSCIIDTKIARAKRFINL